MGLAQDDDMIQQLAAKVSDESFHKRILPGTSECGANFLNTTAIQEYIDIVAINTIVVTEQILRLLAEWRCFPKLLNNPSHGWVVAGGEMNDLSATVIEHHKDI